MLPNILFHNQHGVLPTINNILSSIQKNKL